jgi:hypothetical protein
MYERGTGTLKNAVLAAQKLRQACRLGLGSACEQGRASRPELDPQSELLKLGG